MADYLASELVRAGVERKFEVIGEALTQLARVAPDLAQSIPDMRQAIAFRNLLIHGYAAVKDETVWRVVQESLPALRMRAKEILDQLGE